MSFVADDLEDAKLFEAIVKFSGESFVSDGHFSGLNEVDAEGDAENDGEEERQGQEVHVEIAGDGDNMGGMSPFIPIIYKWTDDPSQFINIAELFRADCFDYEDFEGVTELVDELITQSQNPHLVGRQWMSEFETRLTTANRIQGFYQLPLTYREAVLSVERIVVFRPEEYIPVRLDA